MKEDKKNWNASGSLAGPRQGAILTALTATCCQWQLLHDTQLQLYKSSAVQMHKRTALANTLTGFH